MNRRMKNTAVLLALSILILLCAPLQFGLPPEPEPAPAPTTVPTAAPTPKTTPTMPPVVEPEPEPTAEPVPLTATKLAPSKPAPTPNPKRPVRIVIPAIGLDSSITAMGRDATGVMAVPKGPYGISWYNISACPGYPTNSIMAAHNTWNGTPGTFAKLHLVQPGAMVDIYYYDKTKGRFKAVSSTTYPLDSIPISVMSRTGGWTRTTLITCAGTKGAGGFDSRHVVVLQAVELPDK